MAKDTAQRKDAKTGKFSGNGATLDGAQGQGQKEDIAVLKTYKLYIGGKFPRTESGRYYKLKDGEGRLLANVGLASRKDFRMAVVAARAGLKKWSSLSAYNRGQILYRIAEMLEARSGQFIQELRGMGLTPVEAKKEISASVDRLVYYAGWTDKYQQVFSAVNPVASSHFNFSVLEPTGVVTAFAPAKTGLIGLISVMAPVIAGGNTIVLLASERFAISAISFTEVLQTSDLPPGVVNVLTGSRQELLMHFASHKDVNAMIYCGEDNEQIAAIRSYATENLKRTVFYADHDWMSAASQSPYFIRDVQEVKTTWHPIGG